MIISIIAVGEEYINKTLEQLTNLFNRKHEIKILTDQPDRFINTDVETFYYDKKVFSYFDKLTFPLKLTEIYKSGVLYVDSDMLFKLSHNFINTFNGGDKFLYYDTWPDGDKFLYYKDAHYFKILVDYFDKKNIKEYCDFTTILEWVYYFPYSEINGDLLIDIEKIKPVFEYMSLIIDSGYRGIGNGEGLALSYALNKNKIPTQKFSNPVFNI